MSSGLAQYKPGSGELKGAVEKIRRSQPECKSAMEKIQLSQPEGIKITSVKTLASWLQGDPNWPEDNDWLQTKPNQNRFLQHARAAVSAVLRLNVDGKYPTTWARTSVVMRKKMIDVFNEYEGNLARFKEQWVAALFLSKAMKTRNASRKAGCTGGGASAEGDDSEHDGRADDSKQDDGMWTDQPTSYDQF